MKQIPNGINSSGEKRNPGENELLMLYDFKRPNFAKQNLAVSSKYDTFSSFDSRKYYHSRRKVSAVKVTSVEMFDMMVKMQLYRLPFIRGDFLRFEPILINSRRFTDSSWLLLKFGVYRTRYSTLTKCKLLAHFHEISPRSAKTVLKSSTKRR